MSSFQWTNTSRGVWERPLDAVETHYHLVTQAGKPLARQPWATTATVKLEVVASEDFAPKIREAWLGLCKQHPAIASKIQDGNKVYQVAETQQILDDWLECTFIVVGDVNSSTLFPSLSRLQIEQPTLYVLPKSQEVLLRATHDWVDAEGAIRILDALLKLLATGGKANFRFDGEEIPNLHRSQSFAIAAGLPETSSDQQAATALRDIQEYASKLPSLGLPGNQLDQLPGDTHRSDFTFSAAMTAEILNARKRNGLSPTQLFHAATIVAVYRLSDATDRRRTFSSFGGIFGLRRFCQEPAKSDPVGLNVIVWPMVIDPPYNSFLDVAHKVKAYYTGLVSNPDLLGMLNPHWQIMRAFFAPGAPAPAPATDPMVSSLGFVDRLLHDVYGDSQSVVKVRDFWMATNIMQANPAIHFWTWQGKMRFGVSYNATFYEEDDIKRYGITVQEILKEFISG